METDALLRKGVDGPTKEAPSRAEEVPRGAIVTPRTLCSRHMGKTVLVDGIVTRCSTVRPNLVESVHYSEARNEFITRQYRDELSPSVDPAHLPTVNVFPKRDQDNNPLRTEYGLCTFTDHQTLTLQEVPETAPVGQLPRSIEVRLSDELVDSCKPGDRVRICGTYQAYARPGTGGKRQEKDVLQSSSCLVSTHVIPLDTKAIALGITDRDKKNIHALAVKPDLWALLASSIAPSVYGLEAEKKGLLLMLLGGEPREVETTRIRGDINILLVGEPSTGKSQLLRFILNLAPLVLSTTGRGSTGVGLTAAVTTDPDTQDKTLAAGAMVLGDRGIVLIDEFDKMNDHDRVTMHEAMEQGSVTISKAGIHATLNARCSVLAAANPAYGFYIPKYKSANIGLPESLQSRFDLIFIILDQGQSSEHNKTVGAQVLENHTTWSKPASRTALTLNAMDSYNRDGDKEETTKPWMKLGATKVFSHEFLRKYIQYAKAHIHPLLTPEGREEVVESYARLRESMQQKQVELRVTPRTVESVIRLATAHAKMRLSPLVEKVDVEAADRLVRRTLSLPEQERADPPPDPSQDGAPPPPPPPAGGEPPQKRSRGEESIESAGRTALLVELVGATLRGRSDVDLATCRDKVNHLLPQGAPRVTTQELHTFLQGAHERKTLMYVDGVVYKM